MSYIKSIFFFTGLLFVLSVHAQAPKELPTFKTFKRYDNGRVFSADSLSVSRQNVLVFYDPGCGHCQELGESFSKNWDKWDGDVFFYFISMAEKEQVDAYVKKYAKNLKNRNNVVFLYDEQGEFITLFDPKNFPSTYIYAGDTKQLIAMYDGDNKTEKMEKYLVTTP